MNRRGGSKGSALYLNNAVHSKLGFLIEGPVFLLQIFEDVARCSRQRVKLVAARAEYHSPCSHFPGLACTVYVSFHFGKAEP